MVDDVAVNRIIIGELFTDCFEVLEAENGRAALELIHRYKDELAVVLLDLVMPELDGFAVLDIMNKEGLIKTIPVIMITGESADDKVLKGYSLGVSDLINKPFNPEIVMRRVSNVVALYSHQQNLEERLREQKEQLEQQSARLRRSSQFVIDALSTTVEFRNLESGEHIKRIRVLTKIFLEQLRRDYPMSDETIEAISSASVMHDIGKIAIPDSILLKPGRLTPEEFEIMKSHTLRGCEILESLDYPQADEIYDYCYEICRHHHERWDGQGYPDGLAGDEISIWAQVASVADVYDALTSHRVYKAAYSHEKAVEMILGGECGKFNPRLMECLLEVQDSLLDRLRTDGRGAQVAVNS
jgi:putative two-component system response regulator